MLTDSACPTENNHAMLNVDEDENEDVSWQEELQVAITAWETRGQS